MPESDAIDHYEVLQVSPRADQETIQRVFRHLAKRLHPDNTESGDAARFDRVMRAFEVLSDPATRAKYDAGYEQERENRWRIFNQDTAENDVAADRRVRTAILKLLYTARRNDADRPGIGMLDLERLLGCPEQHMKFHLWYLKENGWLERLENGTIAITASGVDHVLDKGIFSREGPRLLEPGRNGSGSPAPVPGHAAPHHQP
jgi:curved DNA-binding protein CbpA